METTIKKSPRIEVADALRGFAVLAILLVHNVEHFIFPVYPAASPAWLEALDAGTFDTVFTLFGGKAYAVFSLLFGFTFHIQCENQRKKGRDFGYRFLWRLVGLTVFATINAAFFPAGDVLLLYALTGTVLFIVRRWSDRAILLLSVLFLLQPMEWFHYVRSLVDTSFRLPDYGVGAMYDQVAEVSKAGNFPEYILCNITLGQKASLMWAVGAGRLFQTAGLFLLGLWIGRKQLLADTGKHLGFWVNVLIVSAIVFAPLFSLRNLVMEGDSTMQQTVGTVFDMWQKLAFTFVLVSSFVLLHHRARFRGQVSVLRTYGRMSLTNYVTQSVLGTLVYLPFGLNLAPYCGYTLSLLIGIVMFLIQVKFCEWWFRTHRQGPLENLWHKWTWGTN